MNNYIVYKIRKDNYKYRYIEEPIPELKVIQRQIVKDIQGKVNFPDYVNGVKHTSIFTNVRDHINKQIIYKIDISDFYHTITRSKLSEVLKQYSVEPSQVLYKGRLPTGAPTSPILANLVFLPVDNALQKLLVGGISYSRYMDDITFSTNNFNLLTPELCRSIKTAITSNGYRINKEKSSLIRHHQQQKITGIVVNDKANLSKDIRYKLRAELDHHARTGNGLSQELQGKIAFINSVNKELAVKYINYYEKRRRSYKRT